MNSLTTYRLIWPRQLAPDQLITAMRLLATTAPVPVVLEARGQHGHVEHLLRLDEHHGAAVVRQLRTALPGLAAERIEYVPFTGTTAVSLRMSTRRRPLQHERATEATTATIMSLAVGRDEQLLLQWTLTDRLAAAPVASSATPLHDESMIRALLQAPLRGPAKSDADTRSALRAKQSEHGWRAIGRIAVTAASTSRSRQLIASVIAGLRTVEAPGVQIQARTVPGSCVGRSNGHGRLRLNVSELAAVSAWPSGDISDLPVISMRSRRVPAAAAVAREGRIIGESTWPGTRRPLALTADDALRHVHLLGPTGVGKSTLMLNTIEQDLRSGRGLVLVEPRGDLVTDVLARMPTDRIEDVVVLDPTTDPVVACNPLAGDPATADLRADQLLHTLAGLYAANWGPRTNDILGAAFLTLARTPGMSLPAVPLLLTNHAFRRRILAGISDPLGLDAFWQSYDAWSDAERSTAIAAPLNKLRPFLVRPALRRIVGQTAPRFDLASVFTSRTVLLVNLATGPIGEESANLLGALILTRLWQSAQARAAWPAAERHPVTIYLDEFAGYLSLPISLADALAQSRALGVGWVLANQHMAQLPPSVRAAVLANARSRVAFQLQADDAKLLAGSSTILAADDFMGLERFEFFAQLMADGAVQPWCSGRSRAPSKPVSDPAAVRRAALAAYGTPGDEVDEQLRQLLATSTARDDPSDLGPRPRRRGGSQ